MSSIIEIILSLSLGQAAVECSFSMGKSFVIENISKASVINKKLIKDHLLATKMTAATIHVTKEMHNESKFARNKHVNLQGWRKEEKQKKISREV